MYEIAGTIAATLGAIMFAPQAWRVVKTRHTKDISLATYLIMLIVCIMWVIYGFGVHSLQLILVNIVIGVLSTVILTIKISQDVL